MGMKLPGEDYDDHNLTPIFFHIMGSSKSWTIPFQIMGEMMYLHTLFCLFTLLYIMDFPKFTMEDSILY